MLTFECGEPPGRRYGAVGSADLPSEKSTIVRPLWTKTHDRVRAWTGRIQSRQWIDAVAGPSVIVSP